MAKFSIRRSSFGFRDVALFSVAERPDFIGLDMRGFDAANVFIVVGGASLPGIFQQLRDGVLRHIRDARGRTDGVAFHQQAEDQGAGFGVERVLLTIMHSADAGSMEMRR